MSETEQYTEIKLSAPWGHIAAKTYGSPTGKPVIVLHGVLDNAGSFNRLMKYLPKESFYYVCIDFPCHGWSSSFPSWTTLDIMDFVYALAFILEALQWKTCICIGHSMGAMAALLLSVFQPNRIKMLISLDGIIMEPFYKYVENPFRKHNKNASAPSVRERYNKKPLFTKDEILNALKIKRLATLNSEAAEAIFERSVTKVNEKYIYNNDSRLTKPVKIMSLDDCRKYSDRLSIQKIYLFIPFKGFIFSYEHHKLILESMKSSTTMLDITYIDGNHNIHNNNPEKIAPFICKILNNDNISKL